MTNTSDLYKTKLKIVVPFSRRISTNLVTESHIIGLHSYCEIFRKPNLLVDAELNTSAIDDSEDNQYNYEKEVDKIVDGMIAACQKIVCEVANNITQSQGRYKRDYDKKRVQTRISG